MIDEKLFREAYRLLPNDRYIGFDVTQGNPPAAKRSWHISRFICIAKKISISGYTPVFLVEAADIGSYDKYSVNYLKQQTANNKHTSCSSTFSLTKEHHENPYLQ